MNSHRSQKNLKLQSGQAIFVVALIMVGLIGALGLAVDGGGMAFLYRDAQNAADAAALAAAYAACAGGNTASVNSAAAAAAAENGFTAGGTTSVAVSRDNANANLISVSVSAVKPAYFIQLVYPNGLNVTARATAQCSPGSAGGAGYAIYGLGTTGGTSSACHGTCYPSEASNITFEGNVFSASTSNWDTTYNRNENISFNSGSYSANSSGGTNPLGHIAIANYAPGGRVWNSIPNGYRTNLPSGAANNTVQGDFQYKTSSTLSYYGNARPQWQFIADSQAEANRLSGLYYVNGNVTIDLNNYLASPFTIIATGKIDILDGSKGMNAYSLADNILAYTPVTGNCNDNVLTINNGAKDSTGILYAPNGQLEVLYTGGTWTGSLVGKWVDWWGYSSSSKTVFRAGSVTTPPTVALVS
ncbi:MAG: hypothetical protein U0452_02490 [Anaerolineae bacterium]